MSKIIREIIIMLLICLVIMLALAIALYQWIPNRKIIPEIEVYKASEEVQDLLEDDILQRSEDDEPVLSYIVTSSDLNDYKKSYDYVPGKPNPFSETVQSVTPTDSSSDNSGSTKVEGGNGSESSSSSKIDTKQPSVYSSTSGTK